MFPRGKANSYSANDLEQFALRYILINIDEPIHQISDIQTHGSYYLFLK
jgi:hypothetical protein